MELRIIKNYSMLLRNWDWIRVLRLAIGVAVLIQAVVIKDWSIGIAGLFLVALPVLNIGCCGVSGCAVNPSKKNIESKEISYEEVN